MKPAPGRAPEGIDAHAWAALFGAPVAHRGLWSHDKDRPENSLAAFEAAAAAGYAMELDVQLSADGEAVVFHDDRLSERELTTASGRIAEHRAADLAEVRLAGTRETIPTLAEALECVGGRSLVVVELKVLGGDEGPLERRVAEVLDAYSGPAAVVSFNPRAVAWFADHRPGVLRGLDSAAYHDAMHWTLPAEERRALAELDHVTLARPHFLGLGVDMLPSPSADALRARGLPVVAWTVRSARQWARVKAHCDNLMFEGFKA
ncbi:MAG TPA: glycerophosphodiester phosphodiesterase family protein [Caulobacteraceae bacterium]|jgi:glycerophosphoryl diester phosphodiesterase|nr:glycerophosphodiester phosphodiesterase family protein [Caulobacteraceae bacterium]